MHKELSETKLVKLSCMGSTLHMAWNFLSTIQRENEGILHNQNKETWYFSYGLHHPSTVCGICSLSQLAACKLKYQNYPAPVIEVYFPLTIRLRDTDDVGRSKKF